MREQLFPFCQQVVFILGRKCFSWPLLWRKQRPWENEKDCYFVVGVHRVTEIMCSHLARYYMDFYFKVKHKFNVFRAFQKFTEINVVKNTIKMLLANAYFIMLMLQLCNIFCLYPCYFSAKTDNFVFLKGYLTGVVHKRFEGKIVHRCFFAVF